MSKTPLSKRKKFASSECIKTMTQSWSGTIIELKEGFDTADPRVQDAAYRHPMFRSMRSEEDDDVTLVPLSVSTFRAEPI